MYELPTFTYKSVKGITASKAKVLQKKVNKWQAGLDTIISKLEAGSTPVVKTTKRVNRNATVRRKARTKKVK